MNEPRTFLDGRVILHAGDCRDVLRGMADNSVDSVVTDPPYGINFMNRKWDNNIAFQTELWAEVLRVLKPGGYIMAFSGCRTYHRMACAIEDAGFITHPFFAYAFGSGFPKAHNLSKQLDKMAGAIRNVIGKANGAATNNTECRGDFKPEYDLTSPATDAAREWDGWFYGTQSVKPALEPVYFGQKPFERGLNGAQNVMKWGVGAINVGACKIPSETIHRTLNYIPGGFEPGGTKKNKKRTFTEITVTSRWPANLIHDGSDEVLSCFPETGESSGGTGPASRNWHGDGHTVGANLSGATGGLGDSGSAARFFYTAKADADDRLGSKHPTVKPLDLIQYFVRLVTPKNGVCLDLFAGTGTTGEACFREGFRAILVEREAEYIADIERRMSLVMAGPNERSCAGIKARGRQRDDGPLFGGSADVGIDRNFESRLDADRGIRKHKAAPLDLLDIKIELANIAVAAGCDIDVRMTKPKDEGA